MRMSAFAGKMTVGLILLADSQYLLPNSAQSVLRGGGVVDV